MVDSELKVTVEADTDEAVEEIDRVKEKVEELIDAVERLNETSVGIGVSTDSGDN